MNKKKKKVVISIVCLTLAAGAFIFWLYKDAIFSDQVLTLQIFGPAAAKAGDQIEYAVTYKNTGKFILQNPRLIFELPGNSLAEDSKTRFEQDLKDINPGDQSTVKFNARLLGKEGDMKTARAWLSYVPKNLSARYEAHAIFDTKIEAVPVDIAFDVPSKVEKGKEVSYNVTYLSNIDYPLENLSIKLDAVNGFYFETADPTSLDNAEWKLDTLGKGQGGKITIRGRVNGDTGSQLHFFARLGIWQNGSFVVLKEARQDADIINPLILVSQKMNDVLDYVALPGDTLHYQISLRNIGTTAFTNVPVMSALSGQALDMTSLSPDKGQVQPSGSVVVWDPNQVTELKYLGAQQEVILSFTVKLKDSWDTSPDSGTIKNTVSALGINQEFDTTVSAPVSPTP